MKIVAGLLALALAAPALAQDQVEAGQAESGQVEVKTKLICDTQSQVERFVALFDSSRVSVETAIAAVNAERTAPGGCMLATAAFRQQERVANVANADARFDVLRIVVLGVYTVAGFEPSTPTQFFTLSPAAEADSTVGQRP